MRSYLFIAISFFAFSSFGVSNTPSKPNLQNVNSFNSRGNIFDFTVQRLSGGRVYVAWRTEGEPNQISYEVMRKEKKTYFISVGAVKPKVQSSGSSVAEYSFIDNNNNADSTYYCLRKKNEEGVLFYSLSKAVEGVGTNR